MTLSAEIWRLGCSETSVTIDIIQNICKTSQVVVVIVVVVVVVVVVVDLHR